MRNAPRRALDGRGAFLRMSLPPVAIVHGRVDSVRLRRREGRPGPGRTRPLRAAGAGAPDHRRAASPWTWGRPRRRCARRGPVIAFNLAETIDGKGSLIHLAPDAPRQPRDPVHRRPLRGDPPHLPQAAGARRCSPRPGSTRRLDRPPRAALDAQAPSFPPPWIVKSVWEHASVGLEDGSVAATRRGPGGRDRPPHRAASASSTCSWKRYIEGREFNLALLGGTPDGEPQSLPPAEIQFVGYPEGKPRMVGYRAKWVEGSFEYGNTPRRFDFPPEDAALLRSLVSAEQGVLAAFRAARIRPGGFPRRCGGPPVGPGDQHESLHFAGCRVHGRGGRAGLSMEEVVRRIVADATSAKDDRGCRQESSQMSINEVAVPHHRHREGPRGGPADHRVHRFLLPRGGGHRGGAGRGPAGQGPRCGYHFLFAEQDGRTVGYTSFGPIACTKESYDLYWICVAGDYRGKGLGTQLLEQTEEAIACARRHARVHRDLRAAASTSPPAPSTSPAATPRSPSWRTSTLPVTRRRCT